MKLNICLPTAFFLLACGTRSYAQIPIGLVNISHKTVRLSKPLKETDVKGATKMSTADNSKPSEIPASHKLQIQQVADNLVTLKDLSDGSTHYANADDLLSAKQTVSITAIGGAFTFPFKYRPQNGVLEPSLSLSGVAGVQLGLDKNNTGSLSFLVGFGPSSINVNNTNSADTNTANSTRSAATLSFTILGQWNSIQLAVSTGMDNNLQNSTDKWIYQSKVWFSLGIGFNIFTSSSN